jgi:hypothetical protein
MGSLQPVGELVDDTAKALAIPTQGGGAPLPAVSPTEARASMRAYLELCDSVLTDDDYQVFYQYDPAAKKKVAKRFKKKSAVKKLQTFFSVGVTIKDKEYHQLPDGHFAWSMTAVATTPGGRPIEAVGGCSTMEERFEVARYRDETEAAYSVRLKKANARAFHDVLSTAETRATNRAVMNCIGVGGGEVTADEISREQKAERRPSDETAAIDDDFSPPIGQAAEPEPPSPAELLALFGGSAGLFKTFLATHLGPTWDGKTLKRAERARAHAAILRRAAALKGEPKAEVPAVEAWLPALIASADGTLPGKPEHYQQILDGVRAAGITPNRMAEILKPLGIGLDGLDPQDIPYVLEAVSKEAP